MVSARRNFEEKQLRATLRQFKRQLSRNNAVADTHLHTGKHRERRRRRERQRCRRRSGESGIGRAEWKQSGSWSWL